MNERITHILKSPWTTHVGVATVAASAGVGLGYFLWGRKPKFEVIVEAEEDPQLTIDFDTQGLAETMASRDPAIVAESVRRMDEEGYRSGVSVPETTAEIVDGRAVVVRPDPVDDPESDLIEVNVFENQIADWDWEKEVEGRDESKPHIPYILHRDEFYRNEFDLTQSSLTYYAGDDILVDEKGIPIFDYEKVVGPLRFGHGSGEPDTVLVRNVELRGEYEIVRDRGRYEVEVLGLQYEEEAASQDLRHSKDYRLRASD